MHMRLPDDDWLKAAADHAAAQMEEESARCKSRADEEATVESIGLTARIADLVPSVLQSGSPQPPCESTAAPNRPELTKSNTVAQIVTSDNFVCRLTTSANNLADKYHLLPEDVSEVVRRFHNFEIQGLGEITPDDFGQLIRDCGLRRCELPDPEGNVQLTDVLEWFSQHAFDTDMLVPPEQIKVRDLAREWEAPFAEVDEIFRKFDKFDQDRSGVIDMEEFKSLLKVLLRLPNGFDFPQKRINFFWKQADKSGNGSVSFEEFFVWFRRYFGVGSNSDDLFATY